MNKVSLYKIVSMSKHELIDMLKKHPHACNFQHAWMWYRDEKYPTLVAHIDTVYDMHIAWDRRPIIHKSGYLWSPEGIGGDDRCGVYAVMKLYNSIRCNAIFTDGEESGGIGATNIVESASDLLKHIPYFIEIDRKGYKQAVFYNHENGEFVAKIETFFRKENGTFSDVSIIGRHTQIASVNLSAGFYHEHMKSAEYIYEPHLEYTINAVPKLIDILGTKQYRIATILPVKTTKISPLFYGDDDYDYFDNDNDVDIELYEALLIDRKYLSMQELYELYGSEIKKEDLPFLRRIFSKKEIRILEILIDSLLSHK